MNKNTLSVLILISGILILGAIISSANAQTEPILQPQKQKMLSDVQYPISELGNCQSKNDCKVFCDNSKNVDACLAFAKQRNLMTSEELSNAKKFQDNGMVGPGGCKGKVACEQYCGSSTHLEECTTFAKKNGMMSDQQLQNSEKVIAAIKSGLKPPACAGPEQCKAYCSSSQHMEECMTFSLAAGVVPDNQKKQMQKTLDALKQGAKPPACQPNPPSDQLGQSGQTNQSDNGLPSCDQYCGTHQEECMSFSLATGMVPDNQKEQMQKTLIAFKQGIKPPACQPNPPNQSGQPSQPGQPGKGGPNEGQGFNLDSGVNDNGSGLKNSSNQPDQSRQGLQACDQYCADPSHVEECVKFSVAMGNMTEQQAQNAIKNGNKGPGGCIGKDACNAFCSNLDNQETCFNFGKDNGMIPQEDLQKMQDGQQKMKDSFNQIPQEVLNCITTSTGAGVVEKMKSGSYIPSGKTGEAMNQCFQNYVPLRKEPNQNQQDQLGDKFQSGSGNVNPGGQQMPQQAGPGGCKGPEECQKYCASNPEVCKNFQPQQNQNQPGENQPMNQNQPEQQGQMQPNQPGQPGQFIQGQQGQLFREKLEPIIQGQPREPGQFIQGEPGQMQPQQQQQQFQFQPMEQQNPTPPLSPSGFLQGVQKLLANALNAF